jgi:hypothetical protein
MARMKIFSASEEEAIESPPVFNSAERKRFFSLPAALSESAVALRTPTNRVRFLLAAGYFKARHKFFNRQYHAGAAAPAFGLLHRRAGISARRARQRPLCRHGAGDDLCQVAR